MVRAASGAAKRPRISIDVDPALRRRVRTAAAERELSLRAFVLEAIAAYLHDDVVPPLTAAADPVLARLWDNPRDAEYDTLYPR